jgi:hypothetical protein
MKLNINIEVIKKKNKYYCQGNYNELEQVHEIIQNEIKRKILECRFGYGMSIRHIHKLIEGFYSSGYIQDLCIEAAEKAEQKMSVINKYTMNKAKTMIFDETFPRTIEEGTVRLGVIADEYGLIRAVNIIHKKKKHKSLVKLFKSCITENYKPLYFLSDYDNCYPAAIIEVLEKIEVYKDFVHAIRQVLKNFNSIINKVQVRISKSAKINKTKKNEIIKLKKRLLRKQVNKIIKYLYKGFDCKNISVGTIYLEGFLSKLEELANKFSSLLPLYIKTKRFFKKHIETWNQQMESYARDSIPLTSNIIESKNSIFKSFSKKSKSFSLKNIKKHYCAIALYENFDIKTRGANVGTSAVMRAGVDLEKFGAKNFFEAVGIKDSTGIIHMNLMSKNKNKVSKVA